MRKTLQKGEHFFFFLLRYRERERNVYKMKIHINVREQINIDRGRECTESMTTGSENFITMSICDFAMKRNEMIQLAHTESNSSGSMEQ